MTEKRGEAGPAGSLLIGAIAPAGRDGQSVGGSSARRRHRKPAPAALRRASTSDPIDITFPRAVSQGRKEARPVPPNSDGRRPWSSARPLAQRRRASAYDAEAAALPAKSFKRAQRTQKRADMRASFCIEVVPLAVVITDRSGREHYCRCQSGRVTASEIRESWELRCLHGAPAPRSARS